jgi:hypothetical protein
LKGRFELARRLSLGKWITGEIGVDANHPILLVDTVDMESIEQNIRSKLLTVRAVQRGVFVGMVVIARDDYCEVNVDPEKRRWGHKCDKRRRLRMIRSDQIRSRSEIDQEGIRSSHLAQINGNG